MDVEAVLGRSERRIPIDEPLRRLRDERILVTGADGSIGSHLRRWGIGTATDKNFGDTNCLDVRYPRDFQWFEGGGWSIILHLAGAKHAPEGEVDPFDVAETNTIGTYNVLDAFPKARVVLASTCKAADPETAYGASKLIAERMVLNAGGTVARFFNVVESSGNVFETWRRLPVQTPILPITPGVRYFISIDEAIALLLWAAILPSGRYAVVPGRPRRMVDVAMSLYPGRAKKLIPLRRGDRREEPLHAASEWISGVFPSEMPPGLMRICSRHDPDLPALAKSVSAVAA